MRARSGLMMHHTNRQVELAAPSAVMLDKISAVQELVLKFPQTEIATEHLIHGGMYSRTIRLEPGIVTVGSVIKPSTVVIINGPCAVLGPDGWKELQGYNVIPGLAGRKMLRITRGHVELTMIAATQCRTVEDAENEIFGEADMLISRKDGSGDTVTITGE